MQTDMPDRARACPRGFSLQSPSPSTTTGNPPSPKDVHPASARPHEAADTWANEPAFSTPAWLIRTRRAPFESSFRLASARRSPFSCRTFDVFTLSETCANGRSPCLPRRRSDPDRSCVGRDLERSGTRASRTVLTWSRRPKWVFRQTKEESLGLSCLTTARTSATSSATSPCPCLNCLSGMLDAAYEDDS